MPNPELYDNTGVAVPQALVSVQDAAAKGVANGYASLGAGALVPIAQLATGTPNGTKFVRDDGTLAVPAGAGVASLAKSGSTALTGAVTLSGGANVTLTQAGQDISIAAAGAGTGGVTQLFDSLLVGDTASIDTGAGGIAAGHSQLEIIILCRTSEAVANSTVVITLNNDTGNNYDRQYDRGSSTTPSATVTNASANWALSANGNNAAASNWTAIRMLIPFYTETTAFKEATGTVAAMDTSGVHRVDTGGWQYRSTAAITRLKLAAGSGNLKAGTHLQILGIN